MGVAEKVDPSRLPSSTRERFALLYTVVCMISIWSGSNFLFAWMNFGFRDEGSNRLATGLMTLVATLLTSAGLYLIHPWLRARSFGRTRILDPASLAAQRISTVAQVIGISTPRLLIDEDIHHIDALAFGLPKRRNLLLGRGLLFLHAKRPSEFDARVAHEIAHIRNGDVDLGFIGRAMTQTTKVLLAIILLVWLVPLGPSTLHSWHTSFAFGDTFASFLRGYIPALGWFFAYYAVTILWVIIFWVLLVSIEYRSFLRSREHYADIVASSVTSLTDLETALGNPSHEPKVSFRKWYAAHPSQISRIQVAADPTRVVQPQLAYLAFFGFLGGVFNALILFTLKEISDVFSAINTSDIFQRNIPYYQIAADPSMRSAFVAWVILLFLFAFPFAAALGSLGVRICLGELLARSTFFRRAYHLILQSVVIFACFTLGGFINPLVINNIHFQFEQSGAWTIDNSWREFFHLPSGFIGIVTFFLAYVVTNFLFISGLRSAIIGNRQTPPGLIWRTFNILLWTYMYVQVLQFVTAIGYAMFDPISLFANPNQELVFFVFFALVIGASWGVLKLVSHIVSRRGVSSKGTSADRFAPWLYFNIRKIEA
jgi:hypothetical protein